MEISPETISFETGPSCDEKQIAKGSC